VLQFYSTRKTKFWKNSLIFFIVFLLFPVASVVAGPSKQLIKTYGKEWHVYKIHEDRVLMGAPSKKSKHYILLVKPQGVGCILSLAMGVPLQKRSEVEVTMAKKKFRLYPSVATPDIAWAPDAQTQEAFILAASKGGKAVVTGIAEKGGRRLHYTYDLKGFAQAYEALLSKNLKKKPS